MLRAEELASYHEHGFVVCPELVPRAACDALVGHLSRVIAAVAAEYVAGARREIGFWELMARSRGGLEVFWDPSRGSPDTGMEAATMRVGHALHAVDPTFGAFCATPAIRSCLRQIVGEPGVVLQSAIIYKPPRSEAVQFGMHQDASYLTTEPESLALAFVALDDMTSRNGCLEVIPGSHEGGLGVTLTLGPRGFVPVTAGVRAERERESESETGRARAVPLEVEKGAVIFVHGRTYHGSEPNRSDGPRRALIVHAMSARARLLPTSWILEGGAPPPLVPLGGE
jgi:phytanoyl-CoA hydroxylase